ncbi:exopolysaccharide biosynthesis polyprenyl glycosylphosphotransferase [Mangrovibacterium diazotrophicum]|uniref:Exopolysaccharide biosynthesis polyprenyl glycosylphosphotransferase n=2 Tax=Mangrovibacterium diazotrophicum TaxID=1261403 RepID=A0A419VVL3_9BACT|nr:exopolysaccharide biosynthesis polyprenyl glycosylphosphotransferase [Mangrovibacterium diazotrophicum]
MYKEREIVLAKLSIAIQVILTVLCFLAIGFITDSEEFKYLSSSRELKNAIVVITLLWYIILDIYGMGSVARTMGTSNIVKGYIKAVTTSVCFLFAVNIILRYQVFELTNLLYFGVVDLVLLILYNNSVFMLMRYLRRKGFNSKQILIIADKECIPNIDEIINTKDWGFQIWGIMSDCEEIKQKYVLDYNVISMRSNIKPLIDSNPIDDVIYCRSGVNQKEIKNYLDDCSEIGVGFHYQTKIGAFIKEKNGSPSMSRINTLPFISYKNAPDNYLELKFKSLFDFFFSLCVIVLTFPVQLAIAIAIKIDDGGPVFFKQERVGLNGRRFHCFKFRTMVVNAEELKAQLAGQNEQEGPVFKIKADPRITRIGRFLRKTSLDEIPQFLNVIRGDMSVVGPRPPLPSEVEKYERWQIRRLSMKPGITCTWQVSGRNNIPFTQWMKLDLEYIDNWSFKNDISLIFKTVKVVVVGDGS